jgi:hypothetical protein
VEDATGSASEPKWYLDKVGTASDALLTGLGSEQGSAEEAAFDGSQGFRPLLLRLSVFLAPKDCF